MKVAFRVLGINRQDLIDHARGHLRSFVADDPVRSEYVERMADQTIAAGLSARADGYTTSGLTVVSWFADAVIDLP